MCIANLVRDINDRLWLPDAIDSACPKMLVGEPITVDSFETLDGRSWTRVYLDGSSLDQNGTVRQHSHAAIERRSQATPLLAA